MRDAAGFGPVCLETDPVPKCLAVLRLSEQAGAERDEMRELPVPIPGRHLGDEAERTIGVSLRHQDARELPKRKIRLAPV